MGERERELLGEPSRKSSSKLFALFGMATLQQDSLFSEQSVVHLRGFRAKGRRQRRREECISTVGASGTAPIVRILKKPRPRLHAAPQETAVDDAFVQVTLFALRGDWHVPALWSDLSLSTFDSATIAFRLAQMSGTAPHAEYTASTPGHGASGAKSHALEWFKI